MSKQFTCSRRTPGASLPRCGHFMRCAGATRERRRRCCRCSSRSAKTQSCRVASARPAMIPLARASGQQLQKPSSARARSPLKMTPCCCAQAMASAALLRCNYWTPLPAKTPTDLSLSLYKPPMQSRTRMQHGGCTCCRRAAASPRVLQRACASLANHT